MERTLSIDGARVSEPVATHEVRGGSGLGLHAREWGDPLGPPIVFIHGWSQVVADVFELDLTPEIVERLAEAAESVR